MLNFVKSIKQKITDAVKSKKDKKENKDKKLKAAQPAMIVRPAEVVPVKVANEEPAANEAVAAPKKKKHKNHKRSREVEVVEQEVEEQGSKALPVETIAESDKEVAEEADVAALKEPQAVSKRIIYKQTHWGADAPRPLMRETHYETISAELGRIIDVITESVEEESTSFNDLIMNKAQQIQDRSQRKPEILTAMGQDKYKLDRPLKSAYEDDQGNKLSASERHKIMREVQAGKRRSWR